MAGMAANVALKALAYGAPHIPDKIFHSIPGGYFRPSQDDGQPDEKKRSKKSSRRSRRSRRDSYSPDEDYYTSGDEGGRREARREENRKERPRRAQSTGGDGAYDRRSYNDEQWDPRRDYDQSRRDQYQPSPQQYSPRQYSPQQYAPQQFPPPPQEHDPYLPRPYNPADYAAPAAAAAAAAGTAAAQDRQSHDMYNQEYRQMPNEFQGAGRALSVAESRYRPANYAPSIPNGYAAPPPVQPGRNFPGYPPPESAGYAPNYQYPDTASQYNSSAYGPVPGTQIGASRPAPPLYRQPSYSQPGSPTREGREDSRRRRGRKSSVKRTTSVPRSLSGVRDKLHNMDDHQRSMAAGAVGALAGGLISHEMGINPAIGAALGGFALRGWEKKKDAKRGESRDVGRDEKYDRGHRDSPDRGSQDDQQRHSRRRNRRPSYSDEDESS